jgi:hypothetical protein
MKSILYIVFSTVCLHAQSSLPSWLEAKINSDKSPYLVEKYSYKDSVAYIIKNICISDSGVREVFDENGKLLCELKESFAGLNFSQCPGFKKEKWLASIYKNKEKCSK